MKEPKKWTRPRLYWTDSDHKLDCPLIIIYPGNNLPQRTYQNYYGGHFDYYIQTPCWLIRKMRGKPQLQREAMMKYAKENGFKRYFIGEL